MTQNMVTVNGVDVASTMAPPTHVNIHIHQESALAHLKELICCPWNTGPPKTRIRYGQVATGVTQIWLGVVSCALGVLLYLGPWFDLRGSGCAFWAGSVAIAAGAGTIIHDKHRSTLSGCVSGLLTLAGVATAMAALVLCVDSVMWENVNYFFMEVDVCDHTALATTPTWDTWNQQSSYQDSHWMEDRCRAYMAMLMNLFQGIRILLLVVCALLVIASLASLGLGLRSLCGRCSRPLDEEESEKKLLGENSVPSSPSKEKTKAAIILEDLGGKYVTNTRHCSLQGLVLECGRRCCAFNSQATGDQHGTQLVELIAVVEGLQREHKGACYKKRALLGGAVVPGRCGGHPWGGPQAVPGPGAIAGGKAEARPEGDGEPLGVQGAPQGLRVDSEFQTNSSPGLAASG